MNRAEIWHWCNERGWTEPRQLNDGIWVAFPPNGLIETVLPNECQQQIYDKKNNFQTFLKGILLIIVACFVGSIAVAISPLFSNKIIKLYRTKD